MRLIHPRLINPGALCIRSAAKGGQAVAARGQKNKRCCKRQIFTSLLNCGNPNANYRNVKFAVPRAKTIHQKKSRCCSIQIKSSLHSPYYAEACNELRGPSPRLSAWATQLRRNVATVASRWRHCVDLTGPGVEP